MNAQGLSNFTETNHIPLELSPKRIFSFESVFGVYDENILVSVLSKYQRVNLCYCASDPDGVLKDTRFILVRAECPYDQFMAAAHVISTKKFIVGVTNGRERERSQVSDGKVEWALRAWLLLSCV